MDDNGKYKLLVRLTLICSILAVILIFICACSKSSLTQLVLGVIAGILFALTIIFLMLITVSCIKKEPTQIYKQNSDTSQTDVHKYEIKLLENGEMQYYQSWHYMDNTGKTEEEASVLTYKEDKKYYHLCLGCFKKQSYRNTFDYWVTIPLLEAKDKGLILCPLCQYDTLTDEEKLEQILKDTDFIIVRLTATGSEKVQSNLCNTNVAEYVFIKYDYDKFKYFVTDKYENKLGYLSQSSLNKLGVLKNEIENLTCCVYNIDINDNDKFVCDIALILGENNKKLKTSQREKQKTTKIKQPIFEESIDKCTQLNNIIRIDYIGEATPKNASVVTLKNKHKFCAKDFFNIYGYQMQKTAKLEYFFFLDKSRTKKDEIGNVIYPAIKISSKTIAHFPDLSSEEARRYIAISYADRSAKNYCVPADEIDEIYHYRMGKYLYEEQQRKIKNDYCVIDIETTGLSRKNDQIIEISAIRVRNNEIIDTFTQFVKPTIPIPASATEINGITNEMVANAPDIKEVISNFVEFVGDDVVIGHNIGNFDLEFITIACINELGKPFKNAFIDTYPLAKSTFSGMRNYKLSTLCRELGITQSKHRANADCISTKELYEKIKANRTFIN